MYSCILEIVQFPDQVIQVNPVSVFVVLVDDGLAEVKQKIESVYPGSHQYLENIFFVSADAIAETIAINVGIKGDDRIGTGVVFKLNGAYSGFTARSLWDWLSDNE